MRLDKPHVRLKHQSQVAVGVSDATLVDDPIALVDDSVALVGRQSSTNTNMMITMKSAKPRPRIRSNR